jgi:hypothetical protein
MPKFITTTEAAEQIGSTVRYVQKLCKAGRIKGAQQFGAVWMVPEKFSWKPLPRGPKPKKEQPPRTVSGKRATPVRQHRRALTAV